MEIRGTAVQVKQNVKPYRIYVYTVSLFNTVSKWWQRELPAVVIRSNAVLEKGCLGTVLQVFTVEVVWSAKMVVRDLTSDHGTMTTKGLGIRPQGLGNGTAPNSLTIRGDGCEIDVRSP